MPRERAFEDEPRDRVVPGEPFRFRDPVAAALGRAHVRKAVDEMKGGLDQAMKGYSELENGLTDSLKKMSAAFGSGQSHG